MPLNKATRRAFLKVAGAGAMAAATFGRGVNVLYGSAKRKSDMRIEDISLAFEEFAFRTPLKFAGVVVDRHTMLTVNCTARTAAGNEAKGFGTLPLNYTFTFPSKTLSPDARLQAMKSLPEEIAKVTRAYQEFGHPIDINWE